ncbi:hypothetical protein AB833_21340 [Chromatiales bacterium (ex Bugula neritina AB1)]|nr:hypothetical protein AB833_21340 [Chromatiales bacterium (ex Bugula neritina AB1)]
MQEKRVQRLSPHYSGGGEVIARTLLIIHGQGFHSGFSSRVEYLLIFAREKILCGIKDQVRFRQSRE